MRLSSFVITWGMWWLFAAAALAAGGPGEPAASGERLLDDFSSDSGRSALGTSWRFFSDGVMGGVSRGGAGREVVQGRPGLRLRGRVSLENNGGFVQAALELDPSGGALDASGFAGIRMLVRGNGETYSLHLRSADTRLPWQYYGASFPTGGDWSVVEIPFADFRPEALSAPLDPRRLTRVGLVAAKKAFEADVAIARLALYR